MRIKELLLLLWLLSSLVANAQTGRTVTGKVTDEKGAPLQGVSVSIAGSATGTTTNADGRYRISVPGDSTTLSFSFTGMTGQNVQVGKKSQLDLSLTRADNVLDQVVVVGYGTQKRKDVTGAVVSIRPADLQNMPNVNIVQSLQGKLPGVTIQNTGTSAEGSTKLRVRAQNSISADAGPLIVLDGIQFEGFLSEINPNDIESIEVLKDASSAAIYGARAAGGVLLITTKRGVAGKTSVTINSNIGISNIINRPDMMNATQFYNFKQARLGASSFETEQFEKGVNTDWLSQAIRTGLLQEYGVSVAGGAEKTKYFLSGNVSRAKGVSKNDQFNRYTFRVNLESDITSWLKYGTNTMIGYHDRPGVQANISNASRMNPLTEPYEASGKIKLQPNPDDLSVANPLEGLNVQAEDVARSVNTNNYFQVKIPSIPGLSFKTISGYNFRTRLIESYKSSTGTLEGQSKKGVAVINNQYKQDWSLENILNYNRRFGAHNFDLTAVYTAREATTKYHDNTGANFLGDYMTYYQFRLAGTLTPSDTYEKQTQLSQLVRLNYNYNSKYLLTFSVRRDGFSAFGANNKYGTFPSVALGWNMERESFMKNVSWLNRSKLRLSYGENGNQAIAAYATMPTMSTDYYLNNDKTTLVGFYPNKLADPTLSWETTRQINIGWDFAILNSRITGSVDYFSANTYDLLLNKNIPQINGVGSIRQNTGRTKSSGIELALSTLNIEKKDFSWRTDLSLTRNRNKIVDVGLFDAKGAAMNNLGNRWFIGQPINVVYAYTFDGIWQESDDILHSHMPDARPGDVKVKDVNGDGVISAADMSVIGYADPRLTVGLMNTLNYKTWSFSFFFNAVQGVTRYTEYMNTFFDGKTNIRQREWWTPENKINTYPANRDNSNPYSVNYFGKTNNASYIRLSDISLAYRLPQRLLTKLKISRAEVFGNVKNVFTLTDFVGLDPEFTSDYGIPQVRTVTFGFRLGL